MCSRYQGKTAKIRNVALSWVEYLNIRICWSQIFTRTFIYLCPFFFYNYIQTFVRAKFLFTNINSDIWEWVCESVKWILEKSYNFQYKYFDICPCKKIRIYSDIHSCKFFIQIYSDINLFRYFHKCHTLSQMINTETHVTEKFSTDMCYLIECHVCVIFLCILIEVFISKLFAKYCIWNISVRSKLFAILRIFCMLCFVVFPCKMTGRRSETTEIATRHRGGKSIPCWKVFSDIEESTFWCWKKNFLMLNKVFSDIEQSIF